MTVTYESFCQTMLSMVEKRVPDGARVCRHTIYKNNNCRREALCILEEGSNVSPTIYLDSYYDELISGISMERIAEEILEEYRINRCSLFLDVEEFQNFERVRPRIVFKLVNYEKNRAMLEQVPHRRFLDLAVVYYFMIENHFIGNGTAVIYHQQLNSWNVTEEELFAVASENTPKLLGCVITPMEDVIAELLCRDLAHQMGAHPGSADFAEGQIEGLAAQILENLLPEKRYNMYVCSNTERCYGAAALMNRDLLTGFAAGKGSFFAIPSSIHEAILIPKTEPVTAAELQELLREINEVLEDDQEYLSDQIYCYDGETGCLVLA